MLTRVKRLAPYRVKKWIKAVLKRERVEVEGRPCASKWSYSVCECDMQLGAFKQERIRNNLIRILEAEGIEFVSGIGGVDSHLAIESESLSVLKSALDRNGVKYESKVRKTPINTYDFPATTRGFSFSDLVPRTYEEVSIQPVYFCEARSRDAAAMGVVITTFTDTHGARLFHSNQAEARTKALAPQVHAAARADALKQLGPVDVVITTVDGSDPAWQEKFNTMLERGSKSALAKTTNSGRYSSHDELRFLLRSLYYYAPYVRTIHLVTDSQKPAWLDIDDPRINLVDHRDIIDAKYLPTFNSDAIESCLWKIPGLSERFLYFNDDILLTSLTSESTFYTPYGHPRFDASPRRLPDIPSEWAEAYTMSAHLRTAEALAKRGYPRPSQKFKHIPFAGRRSILMEIEDEFADELHQTRSSPIRSEHSFATFSFLYPHFALATGRGVLSPLSYKYIDISAEDWRESLLEACRRTDLTITCINESTNAHPDDALDEDMNRTLTARFPAVPPWERPLSGVTEDQAP